MYLVSKACTSDVESAVAAAEVVRIASGLSLNREPRNKLYDNFYKIWTLKPGRTQVALLVRFSNVVAYCRVSRFRGMWGKTGGPHGH